MNNTIPKTNPTTIPLASAVPAPVLLEGKPLGCTDVDNGVRLVLQHGHRIRYVPAMGRWFVYTGQRWEPDALGHVQELAKVTARSIHIEASLTSDQNLARQLSSHALATHSLKGLRAMVTMAQTDPRITARAESYDTDQFLLNVANGTIDLRAGKLREHDAKDMLTRLAPVAHDENAKCPRWEKFMDEITGGDKDLAEYMRSMVGYFLTGDTKESAFFILHGGGSNGKSVFLNVVQRLLGDYAATADFGTFLDGKGGNVRNDLARLNGVRFTLSSETGIGKRLDEVVMKQITGGDRIAARFLFKEYVEFVPQFKLALATNHLPAIVGTDNGIWRRVRVIPFEVKFSEEQQDKSLMDQLIEELPGILNWAIEGCLAWQKKGLITPKKVESAVSDYHKDADTVHGFISSECVMDPRSSVGASELYNAYDSWTQNQGVFTLSKPLFGKRLGEKGILAGKNAKNYVVRLGLRMKTASEKAAEIEEPVAQPESVEDDFLASLGY